MSIIYNLDKCKKPFVNSVLTIGNFDGVHKGHLTLFNKVKERAKDINGKSIVMTFNPHPIKVMKPGNGPPLITPIEQKLRLISLADIDVIFCLPFTREFAALSAQEFIRDILLKTIGIKEIVVGYDYTFGNNRQGNLALLKSMGKELGFKVHLVDPIYLNKTLISSTNIREFVRNGNLSEAKNLLGRDYQITGTVVSGSGRGKKLLGFPTANLKAVDELIPKKGVYAVIVCVENQKHYGVCNIGYNPTFGNDALSIEPHLFDFHQDIVGETIKINFSHHLRDEKKFNHIQELSNQIMQDIQQAKKLFGLNEQ